MLIQAQVVGPAAVEPVTGKVALSGLVAAFPPPKIVAAGLNGDQAEITEPNVVTFTVVCDESVLAEIDDSGTYTVLEYGAYTPPEA